MTRFITPIILIGISITVFFVFTNPIYNDISSLRAQVASYDEALNNSKALENERDKLTAKSNAISAEDMLKLEKLLPENVDNIRLILELEQVALPYGMVLKDVKYEKKTAEAPADAAAVEGGGVDQLARKDYGVWELEFSVVGTYDNFINFTKDLERNLRIVDIAAIEFSSETGERLVSSGPDSYKYNFKIKTYYLKN